MDPYCLDHLPCSYYLHRSKVYFALEAQKIPLFCKKSKTRIFASHIYCFLRILFFFEISSLVFLCLCLEILKAHYMKSLESKNSNAQKVACFQKFVLTEFLNWDRIIQMASEFLSKSQFRSEKGDHTN